MDSRDAHDSPGQDRVARVRHVIDDCVSRRNDGESISDESLVAAHPDLLPELAEELGKLRLITAARQRADERDVQSLPSAGLHIRCPHCHNRIELVDDVELESITCPTCGSSFSILGDATKTRDSSVPKVIGHFELIDQVGAGQFGAVWMARDTELDRIVAVKIPRKGQPDRLETEQFLREARAAAQLRHPNIVSVHEVGREGELVYIVSDFVKGTTLADWLTGKRLTPHEAAELCVKIAQALHHAHQAGVIHRDLKPSNIMLDLEGEPHLMDFGLARREAGEVTMTLEGRIIGTPAYMSPEQARGEGHHADRRSDIYSLGVILFQLLTGELPFRGNTRMLIVQIQNEEPPSPRTLNASMPRDLETITLRCLEKDPSRRFATAQDVADELRRYLVGEPILARPVGQAERLWRWCRRKPVIATLSATSALLLLAVAIGSPIAAYHINREKQQAVHEKEIARQNLYAADMSLAHQALEMGNLGRAIHLMERHRPQPGEADLRGFEWRYLWQLCQGNEAATIHTTAISLLAYSPNGQVLASGSELRDATTKTVITNLPTSSRSLTFSPRDNLLATADLGNVRLWDTQSWQLLKELPGAEYSAMFSPDGQWLATGGQQRLRLWDTFTWHEVSTSQTDIEFNWWSRMGMAFSPDGHLLATANRDRVQFWEVPSLKELPGPQGDAGRAACLTFSKDGKYLVTGQWNGPLDIWDVNTRQKVDTLPKHNGWVCVLAFSPDGQTLASASADQTIVLWNLEKRTRLATLKGHKHEVWALAFSPNNQTLASGSADETIKFWNAKSWHADEVLDEAYTPLNFSPDDRSLAFVGKNRVKFYDLASRQTTEFPAPVTAVTSRSLCNVAISSDHRTLAIGSSSGMVEIWDVHKQEPLGAVEGHPGVKNLVALSPDGKTLAVASGNRPVRVWDMDNRHELATFSGHTSDISSLAFSPRGEFLAIGSYRLATLWHVRSKRKLAALEGQRNFVESLGFSPDGKLVATGSSDNTAKIWEVQTGRELVTLTGHTEGTLAVCFTPDGRALATAGGDDRVRLWSLATYQEMASLTGQEDGQWITFSRDGNTMATGGWEHDTVRIWRAPTFEEIEAKERAARVAEPSLVQLSTGGQ